jgi:4-amino-4-deoxy-L-arabinose transferase-like glycosyltransferase
LSADRQYHEIASRIVAGEGFFVGEDHFELLGERLTGTDKAYSHRPPLYPYALATLYALFGIAPMVAGAFQALLSSATAVLYFFIGRRVFDERIGFATSLVAALYPYSIGHDVRIVDTATFEFLLAVVVLSMLRLGERPGLGNSILTGLAVGLGILTRPAFLLFLPLLFAPYLLTYRLGPRRIFRLSIPILLAVAVVLSTWLVRNYSIHQRVLLSTYGGWNFLLGNSEVTLEAVRKRSEVDALLAAHLADSSVTLAHLTEAEIDRWLYRQGFDFIRNNPSAFLELLWLKTVNLWNLRLSPPSSSPLRELIYAISYGPILLLSIPGIILSLRSWRRFVVLYLPFVFVTLAYVPFLTFSRYRKPVDMYLVMFASYALMYLYEKFRPRGATPGFRRHA